MTPGGGLMLGGFEADPLGVGARRLASGLRTADLELDVPSWNASRRLSRPRFRLPPRRRWPTRAEHRGGLFTMTRDGRFLVGAVPGVDGLVLVSGCNGSGFTSSLAIGEALAELVCGASRQSTFGGGLRRVLAVTQRPDLRPRCPIDRPGGDRTGIHPRTCAHARAVDTLVDRSAHVQTADTPAFA